jgi:N4-gp56 family major capsid protein
MPVKSTDLNIHQKKWISGTLIERTELLLRLTQYGTPVNLDTGSGSTAHFFQYQRTDVPVDRLQEGVTPDETPFTVSEQTVEVEEWGLYIALTDVGIVKTNHPLLNEALDLVADAQARTAEYTFAEVLNAGTNVQYYDGTIANRPSLTTAHVFKADVFHKARADLGDAQTPGWNGEMYAAVCSFKVEADILREAAVVGGFTAMAQMQDKMSLVKGTVGAWLGFTIVRSNFLPKFVRLTAQGTQTPGAGGSLTGTVFWKITAKNLLRGFEEYIGVEGSTVMGADTRIVFAAPSTAGYVYNIYAGSATGDANLFLAKENLRPSASYNLDVLPTSGQNPPATPASGVTVHPIYIFGAKSVDYVMLNALNVTGMITPGGSTDSDPLSQRRKVGSKWSNKAGIRDANRHLRIEVASFF